MSNSVNAATLSLGVAAAGQPATERPATGELRLQLGGGVARDELDEPAGVGADREVVVVVAVDVTGHHPTRELATHPGDLAFEVTDAGLPGVTLGNLAKPIALEMNLESLGRQSMFLELFRNEIAFGDLELFGQRVPGEPDHFHAIA